jgi:hypothetical protein
MDKLYNHVLRKQQREIEALTARLNAAGIGGDAADQMASSCAAVTKQDIVDNRALYLTQNNSKNIAVAQAGGIAINDNRQQNITINIFGREKFDHIHSPQIMHLLEAVGVAGSTAVEDLKKAAALAVVRAAMLIFSDPIHPENLTCYLPNKRGTDALVHGEGGWEVQPVSLVLSPMTTQAVELLFAKQPYPGKDGVAGTAKIDECGRILRYIADHEKELRNDPPRTEMRGVLIRNKELLQQVLANLPVASSSSSAAPSTLSAASSAAAASSACSTMQAELSPSTEAAVATATLTVSDLVEVMKRAPPPAVLGDTETAAYAIKLFSAVIAERSLNSAHENIEDICDRIDAKLWELSSEESSAPERFRSIALSLTSYYAEKSANLHTALSIE